jgi:hypothetical protein
MIEKRGVLDLSDGARRWGRRRPICAQAPHNWQLGCIGAADPVIIRSIFRRRSRWEWQG